MAMASDPEIEEMPRTRVGELVELISLETKKIESSLAASGLPSPSFDVDTPSSLFADRDVAESRLKVLQATEELNALMSTAPEVLMTPYVCAPTPSTWYSNCDTDGYHISTTI
jgi:hypothetical protein